MSRHSEHLALARVQLTDAQGAPSQSEARYLAHMAHISATAAWHTATSRAQRTDAASIRNECEGINR